MGRRKPNRFVQRMQRKVDAKLGNDPYLLIDDDEATALAILDDLVIEQQPPEQPGG